MNNQPTDNRCPLCDCPMTVSPEYSTPHQKWIRCLNDVCFMYNRSLPEHQIANSPNIRRIKELEELANGLSDIANSRGSRIKELEEKVNELDRERLDHFFPKPWSDPL